MLNMRYHNKIIYLSHGRLGIPFLDHRKFACIGEGCPDSFTILPQTFSVNVELRESEFLLAFRRALALAGSFPMRPLELKKGFKEPAHLSAKLVIRLTSSFYDVRSASFHLNA